jgi:hypothetical protein
MLNDRQKKAENFSILSQQGYSMANGYMGIYLLTNFLDVVKIIL